MNKKIIFAIIFLLLTIPSFSASARSWKDLHEEDKDIFGSEKEEKYPINAFFVEKEQWANHHSLMALWLYKYTDYPRYRSTRVLPFWYSLDSKIDNRSLWSVPLLLTYSERDGADTFSINPLFISTTHTKTGSEDYEGRFTMSLLHYYSSTVTGKKETDTQWWAPIVPLVYRNSSAAGGHQNIFWLLDYAWEKDKEHTSLTRFWAAPLYFWKADTYTHILPPLFLHFIDSELSSTYVLPPVFVNRTHANGERWTHLLPFFIWDKSVDNPYSKPESRIYSNTRLSPFGYYATLSTGSWYGDTTERQFWFPLIPLIYSYNNYGVESHRNILWLFDWHNNAQNDTDRFWAAPLYFWKADTYTHILPPVYMHFTDTELDSIYVAPPVFINRTHANGERWTHLLPFFAWDKSIENPYSQKEEQVYSDEKVSPAGYYATRSVSSWSGDTIQRQFWFPLIPLIYSYNEYGVESHRNILWLFDWHNNAKNDTDRIWAAPLYFWKENSYRHILPPVYMSFKGEDWNYSHIFPLGFAYHSEDSGENGSVVRHDSLYTIAGGRSTTAVSGSDETLSSSWWFPFLPLVYHSYDKDDGTGTRILGLLHFSGGKKEKPFQFSLFPLILYDGSDGGTRFIFSYFRPAGWSEQEGYSLSPLHYHHWSPAEDLWWSALLHYSRDNTETKEQVNLWAPLWYTKSTPDVEVSSKFLLYFYYNHPQEKTFARIVAPLYWNIDTPKRETTLFLPLYFTTQRRDGTGQHFFCIAGIGASLLAGTNPLASFGAGLNEKGIYFDSDISWLINMFSLSRRDTIPLSKTRFASMLPESIKEQEKETAATTITDRSDMSRENTIHYVGIELLYGLIAYKEADSKRHFRVLPLSYLSWDDTSDNKVNFVFAAYLSHREESAEYSVIMPLFIPVYGHQRIGKSHREGYALNAYWNEYDAQTKMTERTVLWPLINWYYSPTQSGWRALPILTWHKWHTEDGTDYSRTFTIPLSYYSTRRRNADNVTLSTFIINPLFYYNYLDTGTEQHTRWNPILPLFGYRNTDTVTSAAGDKAAASTQGSTSSWCLPFFYSHQERFLNGATGQYVTDRTTIGLPLLYYHATESVSDGKTSADSYLFCMGYSRSASGASHDWSFLGGLAGASSDKDVSTTRLLWILGGSVAAGDTYTNFLHPLWNYDRHGAVTRFYLGEGLFHTMRDRSTGDADTSVAWWIFNTSLRYGFDRIENADRPTHDRTTWCLPFFYYHNRTTADSGASHYEKTMMFPIIPLLYHYTTENYSHYNIFWLFDMSTSKDNTQRTWLIPLIFSKTGTDGYFHILPFWYHTWDDASGDRVSASILHYSSVTGDGTKYEETTRWFPIIPLSYYNKTSDGTRLNILGLFDLRHDATDPASTVRLFPLFFLHNSSDGYCHFLPLWFHSWDDAAHDSTWATPLFYTSVSNTGSAASERTTWAPLLPLSWYHSDSTSSHLNILGLFDHERDTTERYTRTWLVPLLFNKTGSDGYCLILPPLFMTGWDDAAQDSRQFILGVYHRSNPDYWRLNVLGLFNRTQRYSSQYTDTSFIFGAFDYEVSPDVKSMHALWGLLADADFSRTNGDYDVKYLCYLGAWSRHGDEFHSRLLPLWYYTSDRDSHTLVIPPLLSYDAKDSDGSRRELYGLGALWTRWYTPSEHSDVQALLLGIPYYKTQSAERGYESHGVLWGLLYDHESESETGYEKISVLKFLYKWVRVNGESYHSVLGVKL